MSGSFHSGYITPSLSVTPQEIFDESAAYLSAVIPGWEPHPGEPDTVLLEASARPAAETREAVLEGMSDAFLTIGELIPNAGRSLAAKATVNSTWTLADTLGHTIAAGTQLILGTPDAQAAFEVLGDVTVTAGTGVTASGEVVLQSLFEGADANELSAPVAFVQQPAFVQSVTIVGLSAHGADLEDVDVYRSRLSEELQLLTPTPTLTDDFAVFAKREPEVARAVAINGYNPTAGTYNNALHIAVCPIDSTGAGISGGAKASLADRFAAAILQNYVVHIFDPTATTIDVQFAGQVNAGYDAADVKARAEQAVRSYLDPAFWGQPNSSDQRAWIEELVVRKYELGEVINRVDGFWYLTSLTLRKGSAAFAEADVTITGPGALASPGSIVGTMTA